MASEYFVGLSGTVNIPYEALLEGIKIYNDTITTISPLRSFQSAVTRISGDARADVGQKNILVNGTGKDINATAEYKARINATESSTFWTYDHRLNALQALRAVTVPPARTRWKIVRFPSGRHVCRLCHPGRGYS